MSIPILSIDSAKRLDIYARKGADFIKSITVTDSVGDPFDFTGYALRLIVKKDISSTTNELVFDVSNGLTLSSGSITLNKTATQMDIRPFRYFYVLEVTDDAGKISFWLCGYFNVTRGLAEPETNTDTITVAASGDSISLQINVTTSSTPSDPPTVFTTTVALTDAQVKALDSVPVELIAAPGANKVIIPINVAFTNDSVASSAATIYVSLEGSEQAGTLLAAFTLGANKIDIQPFADFNFGTSYTLSLVKNKPVIASTFDSISPVGTYVVKISITYQIVDLA